MRPPAITLSEFSALIRKRYLTEIRPLNEAKVADLLALHVDRFERWMHENQEEYTELMDAMLWLRSPEQVQEDQVAFDKEEFNLHRTPAYVGGVQAMWKRSLPDRVDDSHAAAHKLHMTALMQQALALHANEERRKRSERAKGPQQRLREVAVIRMRREALAASEEKMREFFKECERQNHLAALAAGCKC